MLARALVSGLVSGHLWESQRQYRTIAQNGEQAYAGKAVLGLELFSRSSIVIDQSEARALATTELVVETVDLPQNLRGNKTSCRAQKSKAPLEKKICENDKKQVRSSKQKNASEDKTEPYHNAGLLNLVHLSDLLGDLGLGYVGLSGVDDVDALRILSEK